MVSLLDAKLLHGSGVWSVGDDPDVGQTDAGVETEEDSKREGQIDHQDPCLSAVEFLHARSGRHVPHLEGVNDPHGQVDDQEKGDQRAAGLLDQLVPGGRSSAETINDEQDLDRDLEEG